MNAMVYLAFPLVLGFAWTMPRLAVRLPPRTATWAVSVGSVVGAAATGWSLALLALHFVARSRIVDRWWGWSPGVLAARDAVPPVVGGVATVLLTIALAGTARQVVAQAGTLLRSHRLAASLTDHDVVLVVVPQAPNPAQAVPGRPGRIVLSAELLAVLDPAERAAVLAHERAHLDRRHHLFLAAVRIAAAAQPFFRPLVATTTLCVEMWADQEAARDCQPAVVARALVHAAVWSPAPSAQSDLSAAASATESRVRRLLDGRIGRLWVGCVPAGMVAVLTVCAVLAARDTEVLFEAALRGFRP